MSINRRGPVAALPLGAVAIVTGRGASDGPRSRAAAPIVCRPRGFVVSRALSLCASAIVLAGCTNSPSPEPGGAAAAGSRPDESSRESDRTAGLEQAIRVDFEEHPAGPLAAVFLTDRTGGGRPGTWVIEEVEHAPSGRKVLAQTDTDDTDSRFPLCVYEPLLAKDVRVTVRFFPVSGEVDQAAGLVVRYHGKDEYYIARANALEGNVRLYKVVAGKRIQFAGASAEVRSGAWHELGLEVAGTHFRVLYEGKLLFEADDASLPDEGRVGVWTKADSVTRFDDLVIEPLSTR
jgi:hypothetical protein